MIRQESGRLGVDQNDGPDAGSSRGDSISDGQAQGQGGFVDAAKEKIQQLASQARETASGQVESRFSSGKTRATQTLGSVAQTLKSSSQQLRDQQQAGIGKYAEQAANKIEEISQLPRECLTERCGHARGKFRAPRARVLHRQRGGAGLSRRTLPQELPAQSAGRHEHAAGLPGKHAVERRSAARAGGRRRLAGHWRPRRDLGSAARVDDRRQRAPEQSERHRC